MIIFGTGHRSEDCGVLFSEMFFLAEDALQQTREPVSAVICGMAAGFDLAFGRAAMSLELPLWVARPWAGHKPRRDDMELYSELMLYAERHVATNDSYKYPGPFAYEVRNRWMVDHGDEGIAFANG